MSPPVVFPSQRSSHFLSLLTTVVGSAGRVENFLAAVPLLYKKSVTDSQKTTHEISGPGGPITYDRLGQGPPLLLINGYGASRVDWDPGFLENLAGSSTVYCPDNRGIGGSAFGDGNLSIDLMAGDMLGLLDSLGLDEADVAGWSMGGFISQQLASMAPERVSGLVLMSTDPGGEIRVPPEREDWRKLTDHSGGPHDQAKRLLELLFPPAMAAGVYEEFGDLVAAAQEKLDPEVISAQEAAMIAWAKGPSKARLEAITAPVLAVAGSEDVVIPPGNAEVIARHLPDSWLARFPGCAHALMAQEPKRLGNLISTFLGR